MTDDDLKTKKLYTLTGTVTITILTEVLAYSPEEAKAEAEQRGLIGLCHQCADTRSIGSEWVTSGELDGEPFNVVIES